MSDAGNLNILIIDDNKDFHRNMEASFSPPCIFTHVTQEEEIEEGIELANEHPGGLQLILLDLELVESEGNKAGLDLIPTLSERYPQVPIIVVTKTDKVSTVVEATKRGAKFFLIKHEFDPDTWLASFRRIVREQQLEEENQELKKEVKRTRVEKKILENASFPFIGQSTAVEEVKKFLEEVGKNPSYTVLLTGETGVGKEVAARYLHQHSKRSDGPFVPVNLSTINKSVWESMLFGHEKGAFTDAYKDRTGYFQQAHHGILFLDEIGDIDSDIQVKLLRFLEDHTIRRLGDDKDIRLDVQVLTATNKDLKAEVEAGNFREDLFFRLKNLEVIIPPLRERREDIQLIIEHYCKKIPPGGIEELFEPEVLSRLWEYNWPGNIRELRNSLESMEVKMGYLQLNKITLNCLPEEIRNFQPGLQTLTKPEPILNSKPISPPSEKILLSSTEEKIAYLELKEIDEALKTTYGQKSAAADLLGLNLDKIAYRIKKHFREFPELTKGFPHISKHYPRIIT